MVRKTALLILLALLALSSLKAQSMEDLRLAVNKVLEGKSATVGVAIQGADSQDTLSINGNRALPMQSVFKYHLALAVLHQVDQGKFSLDDTISIEKGLIDQYRHLWSPLRKKYPEGGKLSIAELLRYTVAVSDNLGCDVLFKLVGGTEVVLAHLHEIGIKDIAIVHTEIVMQAEWKNQYGNWTTAKAANDALQLFYENANGLLSATSHEFLLETLKATQTGKKSIRGALSKDAVVAHKTGHSGKNDKGLTGAVNDIGIVFLPNGSYFYLSVLLSDSMEDSETNQKIIADIAKLAWDHFLK